MRDRKEIKVEFRAGDQDEREELFLEVFLDIRELLADQAERTRPYWSGPR